MGWKCEVLLFPSLLSICPSHQVTLPHLLIYPYAHATSAPNIPPPISFQTPLVSDPGKYLSMLGERIHTARVRVRREFCGGLAEEGAGIGKLIMEIREFNLCEGLTEEFFRGVRRIDWE